MKQTSKTYCRQIAHTSHWWTFCRHASTSEGPWKACPCQNLNKSRTYSNWKKTIKQIRTENIIWKRVAFRGKAKYLVPRPELEKGIRQSLAWLKKQQQSNKNDNTNPWCNFATSLLCKLFPKFQPIHLLHSRSCILPETSTQYNISWIKRLTHPPHPRPQHPQSNACPPAWTLLWGFHYCSYHHPWLQSNIETNLSEQTTAAIHRAGLKMQRIQSQMTLIKSFHTQKLLHTGTFTHRPFYTQTLVHTKAFTHRSFYTQTLLHRCFYTQSFYPQKFLHTEAFIHRRFYTDAFTHRSFYTQTLLHRCTFTHKHFYTQTSLYRNTFTHRSFYTQTLLHTHTHRHTHTHPLAHKHFYTQTLLHTDRNFYTQTLLHTDTFTQKPFDTQKLRHTDPIYTQTPLHTNAYTLTLTPFYIQHELNRNFTSVFAHRASFRAKGLLRHK